MISRFCLLIIFSSICYSVRPNFQSMPQDQCRQFYQSQFSSFLHTFKESEGKSNPGIIREIKAKATLYDLQQAKKCAPDDKLLDVYIENTEDILAYIQNPRETKKSAVAVLAAIQINGSFEQTDYVWGFISKDIRNEIVKQLAAKNDRREIDFLINVYWGSKFPVDETFQKLVE